MELSPTTPIQYVPFVGPIRAKKLERLGITTVQDLLYHFPHRYNDYSQVCPITAVQPNEIVTIRATILTIKTFRTKNGKQLVQAMVADASGKLMVNWFNQLYLMNVLQAGDDVSFSGKVQWFGNKLVLSSPQYEILSSKEGQDTLHTGRLVGVYPETEGISSKWLRNRIHALFQSLDQLVVDEIPLSIQKEEQLIDLKNALKILHFPETTEEIAQAKKRIAFDELFFYQLKAKILKRTWESENKAKPIHVEKEAQKYFSSLIPFELTEDQEQSIMDIEKDIAKSIPMNRLLVGDVGSGKTIVAAFALYAAYTAGKTAVLMAPTQILAEQHFQSLTNLFAPLSISLDLLTGNTKTISKETIATQKLFSQSSHRIIVGTHALLTNQKLLGNPGVIVIDEQHRFGVKQRGMLAEISKRGITPHLLTMTATPIPRTLAKTLFGNLDVSFLLKSPKGRQKIKTWLVPNEKREKGYQWIKEQIQTTDSQVFIICPFIETSETMTSVKAVTTEFEQLKKIYPEFSIGLLHGKMKAGEKTNILEEFKQKKHQILLATPVVEVGIDIPNATIIVIEAAERFGLGQLHQLRGRVGRGSKQSYCLLYTELDDEYTQERLKALESIHNGPELAELDLHLRGAGDLFGTRQHGMPLLRVATLTDNILIAATGKRAESVLSTDPNLDSFPILREKLKNDTIDVVND